MPNVAVPTCISDRRPWPSGLASATTTSIRTCRGVSVIATYIGRRLAALVLVAIVASVLVFLIIHLIPGNPVVLMLGSNAGSQAALNRLTDELGLNLPLTTQYWRWLVDLVHGNLGYSYGSNLPVKTLLLENYPYTLQLTLAALVVTILFGIPLGLLAALKANSVFDTATMILAVIGLSMPSFWLGLLLITLFSVSLHFLPVFGGTGITSLILPAVTLGVGGGGVVARFVRSNVLETIHMQHVTVARSKGVPGRTLVLRHVLRNGLLSTVTVIGLQVGYLLSGTVIVETVFSRPGLGRLLVNAILDKDYPTVQIVILVLTLAYTVTNLVVDLIYPILDPRIVYS
jgi:ABC-type dipeptide/oligopeptide/nickel transport system permease component